MIFNEGLGSSLIDVLEAAGNYSRRVSQSVMGVVSKSSQSLSVSTCACVCAGLVAAFVM